tara:strand:- start:74 stop:832 length:759 start_codon:yes stop_codon:yes gene_type:complete
MVKAKLSRGKVEVSFDLQLSPSEAPGLEADLTRAKQYLLAHEQLSKLYEKQLEPLPAKDLILMDGVIKNLASPANTAESQQKGVEASITLALDNLLLTRQSEGQKLKSALNILLSEAVDTINDISELTPQVQEDVVRTTRQRIEDLFNRFSSETAAISEYLSEGRIVSEAAIIADKMDIDEELTRLKTHCQVFEETLEKNSQIGRKLDFICQEMHREVNTVSNKINHIRISQHSVKLKQSIERIRQQVQNIE